MTIKQGLAALAMTGTLALAFPAAPAQANGAASTRNIILLGAAATYLIIQHNRKVHERYAADAQRQAALEQENNNAWAAYHQEQRAYHEEVSVNQELKKEVAYQHNVVEQQRRQLAAMNVHKNFIAPGAAVAASNAHGTGDRQVAMASYGWGQI